MLRQLAVL